MPLCTKTIKVYECHTDNENKKVRQYVYFNLLGESAKIVDQNDADLRRLKDQNFVYGVQRSNIDAIERKLCEYINQDDAEKFLRLLSSDYCCTGPLDSDYAHEDSYGDSTDYEEQSFRARPVIEALFYESNVQLAALVDLLLKKDNAALFDAFIKSLKNTEFNEVILFSWNKAMKHQVRMQVAAMNAYSQRIGNKGQDEFVQDKSEILSDICDALNEQIDPKPVTKDEVPLDHKSKFENLKFKLDLLKKLHGEDGELSMHRGYKRFIANFFSILFLGVANLINRCVTGNWLFFNKTTSEEKVSNVQVAAGFVSQEKITFNRM